MADLLFRSPQNTTAILFIDFGCESKQRTAVRGRKHPHSQRRVKGPDGPSGNRISPFPALKKASSNAIFKVGFSIRQLEFSPVELKDTGDAQASA